MTSAGHFARSLRLRRLYRHGTAGLMVTPLDHSISDGPVIARGSTIDTLAGQLAASGVDAVVVHKGSVRHIRPDRFADMSLIVHLNASTAQAPDPDAKYLVTGVEDALRIGADAVSVHVNLGSDDERRQIADLGRVADVCDRWNLPLLAMMYPRGPRVADPHDPALIAHAVTVAVDLGADLVKTYFPGTVPDMLDLTTSCPVPVLVAGGPARADESAVVDFVGAALDGGAGGVAMGRNIFRSADPRRLAARVARLVHRHPAAELDHTIRGQHHHDGQQTVLA
ncbi:MULTISPECIES: 2-amino-3,7-dideoxy-D-threo-hept-6-ulosonate synthase [unclassified Streptomyces]|uniref:2-amino-3,7-dideoxy-D-threo-hept-6-ulosonate synthase n=1 Tax=Streptomyces TaxID=1883 RepID=UPI00136D3CBF|nr:MULTISPECIES: 2-amino-3,7-dideoxy-D-threo-hept-6-ulosonate synthase [unclassified Streptomyces]NEA05172.1 2-amino-4,5-dihydroxy-6-one-heptanoic acid-7-phosphate synthase [Streptomyces sp. SID10116]MYY87003.1 2-amino-4,5-dihydroxy-6-one-heptanoic acid-7-phosphate synthase [Streptomyces sp. SID335]MYZ15764.1 2-amino-4,5-dihydroxy-6-one-heptanoic acid-7-phosphate synthase [Streptomyces sp. SID337]NDZ88034.1 2-amino-4,5-dihydroxy-6-one-heptanoic acid-7-phosphate synthase [Streptomyces sp. SID101